MMTFLAQVPVGTQAPATSSSNAGQPAGNPLLDKIPELEPHIAPETFLVDSMMWLWITAAVLVVLLTALAVYLIMRARRKPAVIAPSSEYIALQRLDALAQSDQHSNAAAMSIELSLILREFITGETSDPTLYETHQEFHQRLDALSGMPKSCHEDTYQLLDNLARLKYSGPQQQSSETADQMLKLTRELIQRIALAKAQEQPTTHSSASVNDPLSHA